MLVRMGLMPLAFRNSMTSLPNLASRTSTTYRWGQGKGNASRSCCTIHSLIGCAVEVHNTAAAMLNYKQAIEHAESQCGNSKEIKRRDHLAMVVQEGRPALRFALI